jgi:preprotein translocase subunit SecG
MYILFVIIHVIVSIVLCVAVLLQSSKGGGLAGAFGGGGGAPQQLLGSRGMTTLLHKVTIWCGIGFMVTSLSLFMMSGSRPASSGSVVEELQQETVPETTLPPLQDQGTLPAPTTGQDSGAADDAGAGTDGGGTEGGAQSDTPQGGNQ